MDSVLQPLNVMLGLVALAAIACRLAALHVVGRGLRRVSLDTWALAHAMLGMGLVGYVMAAATKTPMPSIAQSAFLMGLALLVTVRYRRRREER